ncbi:shikimate kinase [bacterium]|nr:MAG: shikimate kinase [bacterium]
MPNLVLTGFMGTGKTTVGKRVARELGMKFVDTDKEIEKITGLTVSEIFSGYGEVRFRSEELAAVRRLAQGDNQVIATGGGVVLNRENMTLLRANGVVVCLMATPEVIYERVRRKRNRPLLATADPEATINKLLQERDSYYRAADGVVDTSGKSPEKVRDEIIAIFKSRLGN